MNQEPVDPNTWNQFINNMTEEDREYLGDLLEIKFVFKKKKQLELLDEGLKKLEPNEQKMAILKKMIDNLHNIMISNQKARVVKKSVSQKNVKILEIVDDK